jgi:hypothetical protein
MTNYTESTFTAQDMKDYGDYVATLDSAVLSPNFEKWCKERCEPTKKVIGLSVLIDSQIDCEFKDSCDKKWHVSKADKGLYQESLYGTKLGDYFEQCRPRMNHIHAWQGGECPLPEGFMVKVWYRGGSESVRPIARGNGLYWAWNYKPSDIIAFEVLGLADGYVMPWEQDK